MKLDIGTVASVLGILLTIIFFAVGYRQTIGARRERVRTAKKASAEALFRRISLEDGFTLNRDELQQVVTGWAIEAEIRASEMYSSEELESLISSRVVSSDYIAPERRAEILKRVHECFRTEPTSVAHEVHQSMEPRAIATLFLGLSSAVAAVAVSVAVAGLFDQEHLHPRVLPPQLSGDLITVLATTLGAAVATAVVLGVLVVIRDMTRSTEKEDSDTFLLSRLINNRRKRKLSADESKLSPERRPDNENKQKTSLAAE
jgi:hypothetical protein